WLGSGDPFHGSALARAAPPEHPLSRFSPVHTAVATVVVPPILLLLARGVARARDRSDTLVLALGGVAAVWIAADLALLALGLPLPPRFLLPAAAALAVVAGMGTPAVARSGAVTSVSRPGRASGARPRRA
ncbi:MAG TPA: hypothetical protein VN238_13065, partial [Solirubrobacteraceae bacterium]|nr:hypothetical protein [Solirubrobacteraceae bacterium]